MAKCYVRIGKNVDMCNYTGIGLHLREISQNMKVLLTDEWLDVLKGWTERFMWPLQYEVNLKSLTLQTHLTLSSLNTPAQII